MHAESHEGTCVELGHILAADDVRDFLKKVSSMCRGTIVLSDVKGEPIAWAGERGIRCGVFRGTGGDGNVSDCLENGSCPPGTFLSTKELSFKGERIGTLLAWCSMNEEFGKADTILELAAEWISEKITSIHNMNSLSAEILNKYEELNLLYELSEEMGAVFNTQEVCEIVLRKALNVIGAEKASILLYDPSLGKLRIVSSKGIPDKVKETALIEADEGICGYVYRSGRPLLVEELDSLPKELSLGQGRYRTESFLSVPLLASPLKVKGKVIGVINLADKPSKNFYHSGDLKLLASISSQAALAIYNSMLVRELKENERMQKEMEIAEAVQKNLLPERAPSIPGVDLAGMCVAAKKVGGDYYDFYLPPENDRLGIVVADISGHSVSAGIMMAITRGLLKGEAIRDKGPGMLLGDVNRLLFEDLVSSELFITMLYCSYCPDTRRLSYAGGGHTPALLLRAEDRHVEYLSSEGMALGLIPDAGYREKYITMCPGDILVVYTDGIVEAQNPHGDQFGFDRFVAVLDEYRQCSARHIIEECYQSVLRHINQDDPHHAQEDDITLVILKVL